MEGGSTGGGDQAEQTDSDFKLPAPVVMEGDSEVSIPPADAPLKKEEEEAKLQKDERGLRRTIMGLKGELQLAQRLIVERQDEVERLTKQLQTIASGTGRTRRSLSTLRKINLPRVEEDDLEGVQTRRYAEVILPEEIWEMVLHNLTDLKDLQSCLNTCQLFDKILHRSKPKFLFAQVFPLICSKLDKGLMLSCRRVCKDWNAGVDNFLENHPAHRPFDEEHFNPIHPNLMTPLMSSAGKDLHIFSNRKNDLRQHNFVEKMERHPRNPFVGRAVTIEITAHCDTHHNDEADVPLILLPNFLPLEEANDIPIPQQSQLFWNSLIRFLDAFGKHIWYLNLEFDRRCCGITEDSMFQFLTKYIFHLVPNVRRLRMSGSNPHTDGYTPLLVYFLPKAPQLETLHFGSVYHSENVEKSVVETLIHKHYEQLKKLRVNWTTWQHIFKCNWIWPCLIDLQIDGFYNEQDIIPIIHSKMPHLKKFTVSPGYSDDFTYDFSSVMKAIIGLSTTTKLQVVRIITSKMIRDETIWKTPDPLFAPPSLKTLEIELDAIEDADLHNDSTFLLRFPFLENLIVFTPAESGYGSDQCLSADDDGSVSGTENFDLATMESRSVVTLNCEAFGLSIYETDIWELLPRLKLINFISRKQVFTRDGYELYKLQCFEEEGEEEMQSDSSTKIMDLSIQLKDNQV